MRFTFAAISFALASTAFASAVPKALSNRAVHCGTTSDATLSDCQTLTGDQATWDAAFNTGNTCTFTNPLANLYAAQALNLACFGNCCVYAYGVSAFQDPQGGYTYDSELMKNEAAGLLGCGDTAANKVNGMQKFSDGHAICLSDGNGCGDCFDDNDFND